MLQQHSKRFSRLAGLLPLLGLDLAKVELEFLALKMEKIYQVYSKFRNSSRPLLLLIRYSVQILKANNVCPMLRRALWENMKILQSSKLAMLQVFLFVLPCLSWHRPGSDTRPHPGLQIGALARRVKYYWHLFVCLTYLQGLLVQVGLVEGNVHGVAGGHHVVIVDDLS